MTGTYRKKPIPVQARQLTADSFRGLIDALTAEQFVGTGETAEGRVFLEIRTLEGQLRASEGDWIIWGPRGDVWPVRGDIFAETYEPVYAEGAATEERIARRLAADDYCAPGDQAAVVPPPALTEEGRLRAQVEVLQQDAERDRGLAKVGARCMREGHQGLIERGRLVLEGWRFALSTALDLGTGAPWEAIHERVKELCPAADVPGPCVAGEQQNETPEDVGPEAWDVPDARPGTTDYTVTHRASGEQPAADGWVGAVELVPDREVQRLAATGLVGYRQDRGRLLHCLHHKPVPASRCVDFQEVTADDLPDGGICVHPRCGADLLAVQAAAGVGQDGAQPS
ncbi:hypothetical protein [Streptomyces ossamyceticus]|uniref:hypothetical protein n=1 Tax=Streptomyces ossamyceticus TaxID=249581 RepID=UPI00344704BC